MIKFSTISLGSICFIAAISTASAEVNQAAAAGNLAKINAVSVQAKGNLSDAALSGDTDATAEAKKRADAVDASVIQAQKAYNAMAQAVASGDEEAAQSAADDLMASLKIAMDAVNGVIPQEVVNAVQQWKESTKNTGGGAGRPYDAPNMYDAPWESEQMRKFYKNHFGPFWGDKEATPE